MSSFLWQSLIASAVLTILLNVLPRLFPSATRKAEQKVQDTITEHLREDDLRQQQGESSGPRVKVFFPWKAMLLISVVLTVVVNGAGLFFR